MQSTDAVAHSQGVSCVFLAPEQADHGFVLRVYYQCCGKFMETI